MYKTEIWNGASPNFRVSLLEVKPKLIDLGKEEDYFSNEQIKVWGVDRFWGLPHYPKIKYYRGLKKELTNTSKLSEFVVPTFPVNWLDDETVEMYKSIISNRKKSTALCISVLKELADYENNKAIIIQMKKQVELLLKNIWMS